MPNPFKRRPSATSGSSQKGAGSTGKSAKAGSTSNGIRIAANSQANSSSEGQQNNQLSGQKLDPSNLLPPESNYRTSLIMPHLTKRFTLLRAPDGTMVTPEAMRAHLRAQRARARATGVPGTQCFLTEEEEDEIIDQLRRQTRMEEMEEWEASVQQQQQQQQQQQRQQQIDQMQFGGTDGFGTWSTPYQGHQRSDSKIDEGITESFNNLRDSTTNSSRSDDQHGATGRLFSSSSSNRDFAYIKEVQKSRAAKRGVDENSYDQKDENEQKFTPILQGIHDEGSDAEKTSRGESVTPIGAHPIEIGTESYTPEEDAMPGDFLVASHRESRRLSASNSNNDVDNSLLTPNAAARPPHHRHSELLTTLTPEAFNRVSMALEEVYEMVSGRVEESEEDEEDDLNPDRSGATLLAYDSESGPSYEDDELSEERESLEDTHQLNRRPSLESETNSFTSARSEVAASAFDGHGRAEALSGIGNAAAAFSSISPDDRAMSPSAPAGWSVSQPTSLSNRSTFGGSRLGQNTRHVAGKSSMGSSSAASVASLQSNRQDSPSLRRPLHTPPFDSLPSSAKSHNGSYPSPLNSMLPPTNGTENTMISPLAAGFHLAGNSVGQTEAETKAASAAAAAAATAAGVAASNYVAQAQQQQKEASSNRASGQMITSDSSATIVPTSEITVAYPQSEPSNREVLADDQYDEQQPNQQLSQIAIPSDLASVNTTYSPSRPSAAENQVLSANAIAARSPKYFPTATNRSMHSYATGFRNAAPATPDGVQSSANRSEEIDRLQSTPGPVNQTSASSLEVSNHDNSSKLQTDNHESLLISSATVSPVGANSQPHTMQSQSAKSQKFPEKLERVDAIQTGALQPSATQSSLSPLPPSDPEEASKWRKLYGIEKSADATSIRSGISMQISEDEPLKGERSEEQDDIEDDVWARVARTTSPNVDLQPNNTTDSKIAVNPTRSPDTQTYSASANSAGIGSSHDAFTEKSGLSMDELHKIQNDLVRSANAKQNAEVSAQESAARLEKAREKARKISADRSMNFNGTHSGSRNTSLDTTRRGSESITRSSESKVRPVEALGKNVDEERAKSIPKEEAEKRSIDPIDPTEKNSPSQIGQGSSLPLKAPESKNSNKLQRETSSRSFRSQVMYDVTSSHRPTSPPPRTHKTSLSNLPTLQDLSLGVSPVRTTAGVADRNSTSLISMMETSARVHDQLSASDTQPGKSGISGAIAEEEGASEDFEDVAVEDGFGGFTWERRKRLPRSQSHDVLSSSRLQESDDAQDEGNQPSQFSPKSFRSEPGAEREGEANDAGDASWSRLPGEEPFVNPNLIDDVAAQARAATHALKGQNGQRPKMRSKSLGKVRKNLSKTISQPQLVSTTQRMEHTQGLPNVDDSLRKKDTNKRPPFPQEMRSSSLTPASSPVVKNTSPTPQQQVQRKQSPRQPPTQKGLATPADATKEGSREVQAQSPRSPSTMKRLRSGSANTLQSRSVSPTDYKTNAPTDYKAQTVSARKNSSASGHIRRSSSFGHRGQLDGSISPSTQISPTRSASINAHSTNSPTSPQGERGQTGLSRLLTRFRGRKASELPAVIEPYPSSGQSPSAARSSPALSNVTTPNTATSPVFRTPKESPSQGQFSSNKGDAFAGRLAMPNQTGYSSLADMFSPTADGQSPSRTSNQNGKVLASQESPITGSRSPTDHTSALAPAAPIHARLARGASTIDGVQRPPLPNVELANVSKRRSGRETIIRRTIIVSTYDPGADDRRKSVSAARKGSLRKSTLPQSPQQNSTNSTTLQHHRRTSSTTSSKARRSIQDRPPTPPGPDGVSGTHRRKLSQEVKAKPLPPTAKNVYEAPTQNPINANSGTLGVPQSSSRSNVRSSVRASNVSGYGASLYDLYDRDDDDDTSLNTGNGQNRSSGLAPPNDSSHRSSSMIRQSSDGTNTGARHIEVTERADGSVVWQVIAGLADRSSVYTASIGYGGGHSRQNSDTSQYSFMRSPPQNGAFSMTSPMGKPNALADEDGRSLFARTPTKKNFSIDEDEFVPPLPNMNELYQSNDTATATASQQAQQLDFEMATTTAGQAATRIVYTSDAELAALLESLAGPDKSSAKFAFQRVYEGESDGGKEAGENGTESQDTAFASLPSNSSRQNVRSSAQDGSVNSVSAATSSRQSQKNGRPVSIWTESELTSDPTGALRSQRFKIEAEIYSLLQRETAMAASSPPNDFQTSPGEYVKSKIVQ